jgi:hypothetical protein
MESNSQITSPFLRLSSSNFLNRGRVEIYFLVYYLLISGKDRRCLNGKQPGWLGEKG